MIRIGKITAAFIAMALSSCGGTGGDSVPSEDSLPELPRVDVRDVEQLYPYRPGSPYAQVLKSCALSDADSACSLAVLPYISQQNPEFTRSDILDRLLVTHDWMGERFESLLNDAPDDMVYLFGSVTTLSIGSTVRPSLYRSSIGAIRLDPVYLWLTLDEKANISVQEDFRSGYGADLQFLNFGTLQKAGLPAHGFYSLTDYENRSFSDIRIPVYRLLYHELAHAVDYIPSASVSSLDTSLTPAQASAQLYDQRLSVRLQDDLPLYSSVLLGLAQVRYRGEDATEEQKRLQGSDVGSEMAIDGAAKFYSYSSVREDVATLFATTMIKKHFDVDYSMAYVDKPTDYDPDKSYACDEYLVGWGVRNRLADPLIIPRAKWVLDEIYGPLTEHDQLFATGLGTQALMVPGIDWCTNRDAGAQADSLLLPESVNRIDSDTSERQRLQFELERPDH